MKTTFIVPPNADARITYQNYYLMSLESQGPLGFRGPAALGLVPGALNKIRALLRANRYYNQLTGRPRTVRGAYVGRYLFEEGGRTLKVAIDPQDSHDIYSEDLLHWSDIYFKANKWANIEYPAKVLPIVNGNALFRRGTAARLASFRGAPKELDFIFISTLYGDRDVFFFEALAKSGLKKELLAVFEPGPFAEKNMPRLQKAGVSCRYEYIPQEELWRRMSKARIVVLRAGKHLCIPWRMLDLLGMGACIVTDSRFYPQWPEPLVEGRNYVSCFIRRYQEKFTEDLNFENPMDLDYGKVLPTIEALLADPARMGSMRAVNQAYFDRHASPEGVGAYIHDTVRARLAANR